MRSSWTRAKSDQGRDSFVGSSRRSPKRGPTAPIDLLRLAADLRTTPAYPSATAESTLRHRRIMWLIFFVFLVLAIVFISGAVVVVASHAPAWAGVGVAIGFLSAGIAVGAATVLLSANAYRQLTLFGAWIIVGLWSMTAVLAVIFCLVTMLGAAASIAVGIASGSAEVTFETRITVVLSAVCAVGFAFLTSAAAAPLLAVDAKPRLYQARGSIRMWAISLAALVVSAIPFAIWRGQDLGLVALTITIALGLIGSTIAWYRRCLDRVGAERRAIVDVLVDLRALWSPERVTPEYVRALLTFESLTTPGAVPIAGSDYDPAIRSMGGHRDGAAASLGHRSRPVPRIDR